MWGSLPPVGEGRRSRGPVAACLALALASLLLGPVGPAAAANPVEDGKPPPEVACRYHDPKVRSQLLTGHALSDHTWPEGRLAYLDAHQYTRGRGVVVAVVDSGVDAGHAQLRGAVRPGADVTEPAPVAGGGTDCSGHGTMVAGIIAARQVPGVGLVGIAPEAQVLPVREVWGVSPYGTVTSGSVAALLRGMRAALASGAKVINVSVSVAAVTLSAADRAEFARIARLAEAADVLVVAASGNRSEYDGKNPATYPAQLAATSPAVMAVSGVTDAGLPDDDAITGPFISVAAPDRAMPCLMSHGGLVPCEGTSFGAPFVSGLAALVRSRFPELTAAQVRARIEATADHPSTELPDARVGFGVVNPVAALTAVLPGARVPASPLPAPALPGEPSDAQLRRTTTAVAAGAVGAAILVLVGWATVRRGRRRGWRPGRAVAGQVPTDR